MTFYIIISLISLAALGLILSKQLLHSALFLLVILLVVAAIFILAGAEFLGVAQLIIYVGGILILILFGIIVTQKKKVQDYSFIAEIPALILISVLAYFFYQGISKLRNIEEPLITETTSNLSNSEQIGISLMTNHLVALEFMALFLLITLIGAVIIGGRNTK
ncbi:NADH-quinone oxidoreductase subunit J [Hyphobacterium sp. CCMP332]|nr:NADH-quinone oxidoreductase subunit J [Hyphobacterium sp. CCMP332]